MTQKRREADIGSFDITYANEPNIYEQQRAKRYSVQSSRTAWTNATAGNDEAPANTYRLEPTRKFEETKVREIIKDVFQEHLAEKSYNAQFCNNMSKYLSELIKQRVKSLQFSRYKIVCVVHMGQVAHQGMRIVSRCVWDDRFDNFAEYKYEFKDLFVVGTVYGVFQEWKQNNVPYISFSFLKRNCDFIVLKGDIPTLRTKRQDCKDYSYTNVVV